MQSWHYDGLHNVLDAGNTNFIQIEVRNQGQPSPPPIVDNFAFQMTPATFQFNIDAPGQVKEIVFREDSLKNATRLNGFTLVTIPEPTTAWLTAVALGCIAQPTRRRRHHTVGQKSLRISCSRPLRGPCGFPTPSRPTNLFSAPFVPSWLINPSPL
jgi:hypothetical protein